MIISKTPLRISFFGGGTDFSDFYENEEGAVLTSAIDKYIFITVNKKFDEHIRISYSKTEIVDRVEDIRHDLVRESMKMTGVTSGIEVTSIGDIPSEGTGLGSSSAFTVGMLNALRTYNKEKTQSKSLAEDACKIEISILKEPIGKQDQYASVYGGLKFIIFHKDGTVSIDPVLLDIERKGELQSNLMLYYTGLTRKASSILTEQKKNSLDRLEELKMLKELAYEGRGILESKKPLDDFGLLLDDGWRIKKSLAQGISNQEIDDLYEKAKKAGALGGKITGAGGGGFLLLYVPKESQSKVASSFKSLRRLNFLFCNEGSKILYV